MKNDFLKMIHANDLTELGCVCIMIRKELRHVVFRKAFSEFNV